MNDDCKLFNYSDTKIVNIVKKKVQLLDKTDDKILQLYSVLKKLKQEDCTKEISLMLIDLLCEITLHPNEQIDMV